MSKIMSNIALTNTEKYNDKKNKMKTKRLILDFKNIEHNIKLTKLIQNGFKIRSIYNNSICIRYDKLNWLNIDIFISLKQEKMMITSFFFDCRYKEY
jgi:hypothetical protein